MRNERKWHPDFIKYMEIIVHHQNYKDLPNKLKANGDIRWVSPSDKARAEWWDKKILELHVEKRSDVARLIHPKELGGMKPCQICGKKLNIFYVYPNKNSLKKINELLPTIEATPFVETIDEIIKMTEESIGGSGLNTIKGIFDVSTSFFTGKDILDFIKNNRKSRLSPGAMSNPPDRLDGFHTYNACHRASEDTGRLAANLARYTQDRRVYENWADGNWNLSNRLMGEFNRHKLETACPRCGKIRKMTADHIGPISLGFTHRPVFNPLCNSCNSTKNNRMTTEDVKRLIVDEQNGEVVVSWHSKFIWDELKNGILTTEDARILSRLMRTNLHHILIVFSKISEAGHDKFLLKFLHPEYSYVDYKFTNFDPIHGAEKIVEHPVDSKNKKKNADRYVRIAFAALEEYKKIENRNTKKWITSEIDDLVEDLMLTLEKDEKESHNNLLKVFKKLALVAKSTFDSMNRQTHSG